MIRNTFSTDSDFTTFSDTEQAHIERIWQRVAEDYAPFDIDVTTERPAVFDRRTAHALVTRSTDAGAQPNPASGAGGVAYVNVFGSRGYDYYRPAWVYANNLALRESYIAEASSHEIGHNMGLSHDGKTDGTAYYDGHGSGETSWAPIMGVGYYRNVSQWSRGEYYLANNAEDDVAIVAGKLQLRPDDHGATLVSATPLTIADGSNVVSTTPATDPANVHPANKGVIASASDIDLFGFATGAGQVRLTVTPWISPTSYRGGNLDIEAALLDGDGVLVSLGNPADKTGATLEATVPAGQYYLRIAGTGVGTPLQNPPSGYTPYASLGQYFISGNIVEATGLTLPPQAELLVTDIVEANLPVQILDVTYSDNVAIDVSTLDDADLRVTGPNGYDRMAALASIDVADDGPTRVARYEITSPGALWTAADNGLYTVAILSNAVGDVEGAFVAARQLGAFACSVPTPLYRTDLGVSPGWTLESPWAYGAPQGQAGDPAAGADGPNVIGYNLNGAYARRADMAYAITPPIDCAGALGSVVLRFKRWLGIESGDSAVIELSAGGGAWVEVWSAAGAIADGQWVTVQYDITALAAGQTSVRLRWGLGSNPDIRVSYGWNLDAVEVLSSGGVLDTQGPVAVLNAPDLREGGYPNYPFAVAYSDDVAVAIATLGDANLTVLGPNGYSNDAAFVGVDDLSDGTPRTASYTIPAPGDTWTESDNGDYDVFLNFNEVRDTSGNAAAAGLLGGIRVAIVPRWTLTVTLDDDSAGSIDPPGGLYEDGTRVTLTASPNAYFVFANWELALAGTNPVAELLMDTNKIVGADFQALLTTNHPTPYWWLARYGFTNDFEWAAEALGANDMPRWASYIAGVDPTDPADRFAITSASRATNRFVALAWPAVSGRVYSVYAATHLAAPFQPVAGATNLPWPASTATVPATNPAAYYRLGVTWP